MYGKKWVLIIYFLLLTGCSILSPVQPSKMNTYLIDDIPQNIQQKKGNRLTLLVMPPTSRPIYHTNQIAYTVKPFQIRYFVQNQWAETPSQMFLPLLVNTLQQTHYFRAIVTPPYEGKYNYILNTHILRFQLDATRQPNKMQFNVLVQLIHYPTQKVIATKLLTVQVRATKTMPYGVILAANEASQEMLAKIAIFCLTHLQ